MPRNVLFLHGLGGGPFELTPLIDAARGAGARVSAPILPGHEGPGPKMPSSLWKDWAGTTEAAFDALAFADPSPGRVAVVGFSTGATLGLRLATRRPVDRLVLLAPFFAVKWGSVARRDVIGALARVFPDLPKRGPALRDAAARRALRRDKENGSPFRTFSLGATLSALELIEEVKPLLGAVNCPALILQGRRDSVVEPHRAPWLFDRLGSADKQLAWLARSDHLLALDLDRDEVLARTMAFLDKS